MKHVFFILLNSRSAPLSHHCLLRKLDSIIYRETKLQKETWWLGIVNHGNVMPIENGYRADLKQSNT